MIPILFNNLPLEDIIEEVPEPLELDVVFTTEGLQYIKTLNEEEGFINGTD